MALEPTSVDETFFEKNNIPFIIISKYCSEGDNIPDAIKFV